MQEGFDFQSWRIPLGKDTEISFWAAVFQSLQYHVWPVEGGQSKPISFPLSVLFTYLWAPPGNHVPKWLFLSVW